MPWYTRTVQSCYEHEASVEFETAKRYMAYMAMLRARPKPLQKQQMSRLVRLVRGI